MMCKSRITFVVVTGKIKQFYKLFGTRILLHYKNALSLNNEFIALQK